MRKYTFNTTCILTCILAAILISFTFDHCIEQKTLIIITMLAVPVSLSIRLLIIYTKDKYDTFINNNNEHINTHLTLKEMITEAIVSVISITFMSTSSPLYPFNL